MISVRCPHCGAQFNIDPKVETVSTRTPGQPDTARPVLSYQPLCPSCTRRVVVKVPAA